MEVISVMRSEDLYNPSLNILSQKTKLKGKYENHKTRPEMYMLCVLTLSWANSDNDHLEISSDKLVPLSNDKNSDQISHRGTGRLAGQQLKHIRSSFVFSEAAGTCFEVIVTEVSQAIFIVLVPLDEGI